MPLIKSFVLHLSCLCLLAFAPAASALSESFTWAHAGNNTYRLTVSGLSMQPCSEFAVNFGYRDLATPRLSFFFSFDIGLPGPGSEFVLRSPEFLHIPCVIPAPSAPVPYQYTVLVGPFPEGVYQVEIRQSGTTYRFTLDTDTIRYPAIPALGMYSLGGLALGVYTLGAWRRRLWFVAGPRPS